MINKLYELESKMDKRMDRIETDLAVIKKRLEHLDKANEQIKKEIDEIDNRIRNRDKTFLSAFTTAAIGFLFWLAQQGIAN